MSQGLLDERPEETTRPPNRDDAQPGRPWWDRPGGALAVALVLAGSFLLWETSTLWFFGDDWAFLLGRSLRGGTDQGLLEPHNEHWSTLPVLVYRVMFHLVGLDGYLAFAALPILAHISICVLLYVLLRRCGADGWPSACAVLVLAFAGLGENTLWSFQIGFLGSLVLGVGSLLAVQSVNRPAVAVPLAAAALTASLMASGMGMLMLLWAALFTVLHRGLLWAVAVAAVPSVAYAAWYFSFGREAPDQLRASTLEIIQFGWTGVDAVWQNVTANSGAGSLVPIALGVVVVFARTPPGLHALSLAGMAALLPAFLLIGVSRASLGAEVAGSNRYAHLGLLLCIPALAVAFRLVADRFPDRGFERLVVIAAVLGFVVVQGMATTDFIQEGRKLQADTLRTRLAAALRLEASDERLLRQQPEPVYNPDITVAALRGPKVSEALAGRPVDAQALLEARVHLQVATSATPVDLPPVRELDAAGVVGEPDPGNCSRAVYGVTSGRIDLVMGPRGGQAWVITDAPQLQVQLVDAPAVSGTATLAVMPGAPVFLASTAPGMVVRLLVADTRITVCAPPSG